MKPKFRKEAEIYLRELFDRDNYPFQSCINCCHFKENETCDIVNQKPPAKVIVFGCPQYVDEIEIPY